jgi:hypothetical protein
MEDKKKVAAMLVMGLKPKKSPMSTKEEDMDSEVDSEDPSEEGSDHEAAAQEVMDALKSDDVAGFTEALKSFIKLCDYPEEGGEEDE